MAITGDTRNQLRDLLGRAKAVGLRVYWEQGLLHIEGDAIATAEQKVLAQELLRWKPELRLIRGEDDT